MRINGTEPLRLAPGVGHEAALPGETPRRRINRLIFQQHQFYSIIIHNAL